MARRRVMLAAKKARLPREYQEVEHLTNPYGGYIDTGMQIVSGDIICLSFLVPSVLAEGDYVIYGWRRAGSYLNNKQAYVGTFRVNTRYISVGVNTGMNRMDFDFNIKNTVIIDTNFKTVYINGDLATFPYSFAEGTLFNANGLSEFNPYIFALNSIGAISSIDKASQFFEYAVSSYNGVSKSNLIPCYRRIDSKSGVFDLARNLFISSANSYDFVCGPNVN